MNKYKKLGKNTILFIIGNFTQKILGFFLVPLYTAFMTTEQYGTADLVVTLVSMLWPLCTIVINEACFRFLLDKQADKRQIISACFWINMLGIGVFLLISPLAYLVSTIKGYYLVIVIYFIVYTMESFLAYTARGMEKITEVVIGGIISSVVAVGCNLLFIIVFKFGVIGYLVGYIIGMSASTLWYFFKVGIASQIISPFKLDKKTTKEMIRYSLPMTPNSISWWISNSSDRLLVTYYCGAGMNGIYSVAYKIPSLLSVISSVFVNAWQISAVEDFGSEENRKFFSNVYRKYLAVNICGTSFLILCVRIISRILFSADFFSAYLIAPYLLLGAVFKTLSAFLGAIYTSSKKTKMLFYSTMAGAVINIVLNVLFLKTMGVVGAAVATLISYFVVWLVRIIDTSKILMLERNHFIEIGSYLLVLIQILIWTFNISSSYLLEAGLFLCVMLIQSKELVPVVIKLLKSVKR